MVIVSVAFFQKFQPFEKKDPMAGKAPFCSMNIFFPKGVFMRNEQKGTDSAERNLEGI